MGAALNTLLDHVESSLAVRHRSEQQVRQFVADASHELRTPLATIAGYTELARRQPAAQATALDKVEGEAARMTGLVEDLLLLARLDAGRPLVREPVDLSLLLMEAVNDARVVAPDHTWRLALPDEPVEVVGDEQRLHQVVTNLLTNARKYTPPGTTVTVTARRGRLRRARRRARVRAAGWPSTPSSGSCAATRRGTARAAPGSGSRWSRRSPAPTAAPSPSTAGRAARRSR